MKKELAVVLVSGGMDSCVTAGLAKQNFKMAFLHLNYGQRTQTRELKAFQDIADFYSVRQRLIVDVQYFTQIGGSSLTEKKIKINDADLITGSMPTSYVPFRNANILSIATSWAEVIGATRIFIGAVEEDSSGYPDCRNIFFQAFNKVIAAGTRPETNLKIVTPILQLSKKQIVEQVYKLKAPIHLTWSCYKNEDIACGVCASCALRLKGFQQAGIEDPLEYIKRPLYI